ncbi:hypothetical protein ACQR1F_32095, partial [Bradyrhizobium sp. HKCCYLS3013]
AVARLRASLEAGRSPVYKKDSCSPVRRLSGHRRPRDAEHHNELDISVGMPGPRDLTVRIGIVRPRGQSHAQSDTPIASHTQRS